MSENEGRRVGIAMISGDMMHSRTAMALTRMVGYQIAKYRDDVRLCHEGGSILSQARQRVTKILLEEGADWIMFIDSDMNFPKDTLQRLLSHDVDVVAANCSKRRRPVGPTARRVNSWMGGRGNTEPVMPDPNRDPALGPLEKVEAVGTGLMLIKAEVFTKIEWPWFHQPWVPEVDDWMGEDVHFCGRCYEAGVPVYIDHDLSWSIEHIGIYGFGMKDVLTEARLVSSGAWGPDPEGV